MASPLTMNCMDAHVANVARSCFYQLRQLRSVRRSLIIDIRHTLVSAFIASRVDYCNAVLYGVSAKVTRRLQMVLNAAARLLVGTGKYDHITPALCDVLNWLPLPQRTEFKIAVLAFDCVRGTGPAYFTLFLRSIVSVVLALTTSKMSACRCRILLLGALSVRRSVVTCLFLEQEQ